MEKSADAFRTISEVAVQLDVPQHVLRFWETRFPQIRPMKRAGGRRYYRPADVVLLQGIRRLLYEQGYTIKGVQRLLKERGQKGLDADRTSAELDDFASDDTIAPATSEVDASGFLPPPVVPTREQPSSGFDGADRDHAALVHALADLEECERIIAGVRRPAAQ